MRIGAGGRGIFLQTKLHGEAGILTTRFSLLIAVCFCYYRHAKGSKTGDTIQQRDATSIESDSHFRFAMTEAFKHRQEMLHDCLMTFQDPDVPPSTGLKLVDTADIAKLQAVLREAEACFELYEHFDDGIHPPCAELQAKIDARKLAELGVEPVPSRIKVRAWSQLRVARTFLAHAYEAIGAHEEALPLFRLQVEQTLRMRDETWDKKNIFHSAINNLVCCLIHSGKFEEAKEWNDRGLHFCEQEDPESPMHKSFKHNLAVMAGRKAGPAQGSGDEPSGKARKKCWNCGTVECAATKLLRCSKCDDLKVATPAYYCSKECQQVRESSMWPHL